MTLFKDTVICIVYMTLFKDTVYFYENQIKI